MSKVVPFQGQQLPAVPAYLLSQPKDTTANDEFTAGLSSGFVAPPKLGIEGGKFHIIDSDGADIIITKRDESGNSVPMQLLSVVVLASNPGKYKVFYGEARADGTYDKTKYDPNAETGRPVCYSYDGVTPSPNADVQQCATCAACPHNVWGSYINELGNKGRACTDGKLLAVLPTSSVKGKVAADTLAGTALSLKLSPTALNRNKQDRKTDPANAFSWMEFMQLLNAYPIEGGEAQIPLRNVAVTLFFNMKAQYPLLQFKLGRFLLPEEIAYVQSRVDGDDVRAIVQEQGQGPAPVRPPRVAAPAAVPAIAAPKPPPPPDTGEEMDLGATTPPAPAAAPPRRGRPAGNKAAAAQAGAAAAAAPPQQTDAAMDEELKRVGEMFGD